MVVSKPADEGTDVEKLNLHNRVIPRVEKTVHEIESDLQKYSWIADPAELGELMGQVDPIVEEASNFIATVTSLYDENEGYAPTLSGLEKAMAEIKPFSAGSDVTVFEFLDKFNTYMHWIQERKGVQVIQQLPLCFHPSSDEFIPARFRQPCQLP